MFNTFRYDSHWCLWHDIFTYFFHTLLIGFVCDEVMTCQILREKFRMKNVECLFKVSKSAWVLLFL